MTVHEAAKALEIGLSTVYTLCNSGKLGHVRIGQGRGTIRISEQDIEAFKEACRVRPKEPDAWKGNRRGRWPSPPPIRRLP